MASRRILVAAILVVVIIVVLAAVTAYYLTLPPSRTGPVTTNTCTGTKAYSGVVQNDTAVPVAGAVVSLKATPPNLGTNATATTDANGAWSATVSSGCAYTAVVYWQSSVNSPILARQSNLSTPSTVSVHVSWQNVNLTLLEEFPHSANANVTVTTPLGFSFFVEANSTGSIPLGFLQTDAAGSPGYGFSQTNVSGVDTGSLPWAIIWPAARAYQVRDMNGNSVVYAVPVLSALFQGENITDALTMANAIAQVQARGGNPYHQVAAHGTATATYNVTNATHVFTAATVGVFGVSLETFVSVPTNSTLELGLSVQLLNTTNRVQCYVVDPEGPQVHTWYYGPGACP